MKKGYVAAGVLAIVATLALVLGLVFRSDEFDKDSKDDDQGEGDGDCEDNQSNRCRSAAIEQFKLIRIGFAHKDREQRTAKRLHNREYLKGKNDP